MGNQIKIPELANEIPSAGKTALVAFCILQYLKDEHPAVMRLIGWSKESQRFRSHFSCGRLDGYFVEDFHVRESFDWLVTVKVFR